MGSGRGQGWNREVCRCRRICRGPEPGSGPGSDHAFTPMNLSNFSTLLVLSSSTRETDCDRCAGCDNDDDDRHDGRAAARARG